MTTTRWIWVGVVAFYALAALVAWALCKTAADADESGATRRERIRPVRDNEQH